MKWMLHWIRIQELTISDCKRFIRIKEKAASGHTQFFLTSHRKEAFQVADKTFKITFKDKSSSMTELLKTDPEYEAIISSSQGENYI